MGRFIITEEEKSYIQSLYRLNEQTENHSVEEIQTFLNSQNEKYNCGTVDGRYGPKTANALSLYLADKKAGTIAPPPVSGQETASSEATTPSEEESEVSKIEKQLNGVSAEEVKKDNEESQKRIKANQDMKKSSRKDCRGHAASARYWMRKGFSFEDSAMNKEVLSYCLNTYMKRGEKKTRQWAGIN